MVKEKIYINISFDDLHPEDWWGNKWDNVITSLLKLKEQFSDIKYTFFTVPNFQNIYENKWISLIKRRLHLFGIRNSTIAFSKILWSPFMLSRHTLWCDFIKQLIRNKTFELWIHWYNHYSPYEIPAAEFHNLSQNENLAKIQSAIKIFQENKLPFTWAFRPPAWGVNPTLQSDLLNLWFQYLSLDPDLKQLIYDPKKHFFSIPQNYSIEDTKHEKVFEHLKENNFLFIKGHLYEKLENGIKTETIENLTHLLISLQSEYQLQFIFIHEIEQLYLDNQLKNVYKI